MYCSSCGNKVNDNAKFCAKCGSQLYFGENNEATAPGSPVHTGYASQEPAMEPAVHPKRPHKTRNAIFIAAGGLIVICGVLFVIFGIPYINQQREPNYTLSDNEDEQGADATEEETEQTDDAAASATEADITETPDASPENSQVPVGSQSSNGLVFQKSEYYFDPDKDYASMEKYQVVYITYGTGYLYDLFNEAYASWAERMNCEYAYYSANDDSDLYMSMFQTYAAQGYDGFILDPDINVFPRIIEIADEMNINWMPSMTEPLDDNGQLAHPFVTYDNVKLGMDMASWTINYVGKTWPHAKPNEIGMISMEYSGASALHERTTGAQDVWNTKFPGMTSNFFTADGAVTGGFDADAGAAMVSGIMAANPGIQYWLITACFDDYAAGAVQAAENAGIEQQTVVMSVGGTPLFKEWDAGSNSCWKASIYMEQNIYAEPIFCGLYDMMSGKATAASLWPECIDPAQGYAVVSPAGFILTKDNYRNYLEWTDAVTGGDRYHYDNYNGSEFPVTCLRIDME